MTEIKIGEKNIGNGFPVYIIAEVGSNFDGSLERAKHLAKIAKNIGADAYKIQNFLASKIVSAKGFQDVKISFQAKWDRPVVEIYKKAEFPRKWLKELSDYCREIGIDFLSTPYDKEAVDLLEEINVPAYKIGSGEIDNFAFLEYIAKTQKPILLSCGASTKKEIKAALLVIKNTNNNKIVLLQCITNYPSSIRDAEIRTMVALKEEFGIEIGYSDHTIGQEGSGDDPLSGVTVPLGAVALGAKVIEKHFTDDRTRKGPDHAFAMETKDFKRMVRGIRAMESALGDGIKKVMSSEKETVIIQRRGIYALRNIKKGEKLSSNMLEFLRPAIGLRPSQLNQILNKTAQREIKAGEIIKLNDFI